MNKKEISRRNFISLAGYSLLALGASGCRNPFHKKSRNKRRNTGPDLPPIDPNGPNEKHVITGDVIDISGNARSGELVRFYFSNNNDFRESISDSSGSYMVDDIPARVDGNLVVDRVGYYLYKNPIGFVETSADPIRDVILIPQVVFFSDHQEYKNKDNRASFLQFLKYVTGNRDGQSLNGGSDPTRYVEHLMELPIKIKLNTGSSALDDKVNEAIIDIHNKVEKQLFVVTSDISNAKLSVELGRNQGVSVVYDITRNTIGADRLRGYGAVSAFKSGKINLADWLNFGEIRREAERGLTRVLLGPNAKESVDPGHLTYKHTLNQNSSVLSSTEITFEEAKVISVYTSLPNGYNMSNIRERS